jgi:CBS domain-containing protein
MANFPLQRIIDFLQDVPPFDTLDEQELIELAGHMEIAFYPRGEIIIKRGTPPPTHLHIIQVGSARISIKDEAGEELLVDKRGEGDIFGAVSLLKGKEALFDIIAEEDLIALLLPAQAFKNLVDTRPAFERHFNLSLAHTFRSVRKSSDHYSARLAGTETAHPELFLMGKRVSDLMVTNVLTCPPETSIREAAQQMTQRRAGSIVVQGKEGSLLGIVTDRDLRSKVMARGLSNILSVTEIMSHPLHSIESQSYAFDALLDMSRHGISHILVTENHRLVGIISEHDFRVETGASPVGVIRDIEKSQSISELLSTRAEIDQVRERLLRQGGSVKKTVELITELNDRVTLKLLKLTELEMEKEGLGQPPISYCWMALGSEGRREQTLRTDQDNAVVLADVPGDQQESAKRWFLTFAEKVVEGLVKYGFPRCPGGIMASNPQWCMTETEWEKTFVGWVEDPNPLTLRMATIFFDFRPLYAGTDFLKTLRLRLSDVIKENPLFLRFLAKNSLYIRPPLGFLKNIVVEKSGEHKDELNLKTRGLTPVVDSARILALDLGLDTTNTLDRLTAVREKGILDEEFYEDLQEAYSFINYIRIGDHLEALSHGKEPDNFINPASLNSLQRKVLKESFGVINRLQEMIEFRYQTQFILGS